MHNAKRSIVLLVISILSAISLAFFMYFVSPNWEFPIFTVQITSLYIVFVLLFGFLFCLVSFIFNSKTHGLLVALFVIIYLLFRLNNLTHPLFLLLLAGLFIVFELFLSFKK